MPRLCNTVLLFLTPHYNYLCGLCYDCRKPWIYTTRIQIMPYVTTGFCPRTHTLPYKLILRMSKKYYFYQRVLLNISYIITTILWPTNKDVGALLLEMVYNVICNNQPVHIFQPPQHAPWIMLSEKLESNSQILSCFTHHILATLAI